MLQLREMERERFFLQCCSCTKREKGKFFMVLQLREMEKIQEFYGVAAHLVENLADS